MKPTFDITLLPDIASLSKLTRALSMLDAIVCPEWESRYYSFDSAWAKNELMASMRNGSGDHWFILFCAAGAALHGLAHESEIFEVGKPASGIFNSLPLVFHANFLNEPAFDTKNSTFCFWRGVSDPAWSRGQVSLPNIHDADGSIDLVSILRGDPAQYVEFASDYYQCDISLEDVAAIYNHTPLTNTLVQRLNPDISIANLAADIEQIGYQ